MAKYTMRNLAEDVLKSATSPMRAQDIWAEAERTNLADKVQYSGKTPAYINLYNILNGDINNNSDTVFAKLSKNPALFTLKENKSGLTTEAIEQKLEQIVKEQDSDNTKYNESDLHPVLAMFAYFSEHFNCRVKTIRQQRAKKRKANENSERIKDEWQYPDLIGVYFPFTNYKATTNELLNTLSTSLLKIFSFEIKKTINASNLRKAYFQAVSNSSWANEGYLVAAEVDNDPDFIKEVTLLTNAFGIGLIRLDIENPLDSEIVVSAKIRDNLDYDMLDKLMDFSDEVEEFFTSVNKSVAVKSLVMSEVYDEVLNEDDYRSRTHVSLSGLSGRKK